MSLLKVKTNIRRSIYRFFRTNRPSSFPFISGDSFRAIAQHIYDEHFDFNPESVQRNEIVFVRGNFLIDFLKNIHPKIKNEYVLISHNDDTNIDESYEKYIDNKIIHWFAQNITFKHSKMTPIPIGIPNFCHDEMGKLRYFDQKNIEKEPDVSIKFGFVVSNKERISALENLSKSSLAKRIQVKNQDEYIDVLKKSYYVASPTGSGLDCHRTWEAIYLKTIPIVIKNPMNEYFKSIGLPILLINSWDEIHNFTGEFLEKEYRKIYQTDSFPQIFMDYWQKKIINYKI